MDLMTLPGVFSPISDSRLLAEALRREALPDGARVLDLCTGSGIIALTAAEEGADATAIDISRRAVLTVRLNALRNRQTVRACRGRLFEPVAGERFDCIVSNPPYVPSDSEELPRRGASRAWAAGRDGRVVLDEICREAPNHLVPGGIVLLTHSDLIGDDLTVERLCEAGLVDVEIVERHRGPLGPLMVEQQRVGTIPADVTEEDVVIIRGRAPDLAPGA
jgi:release factor glutamine methyltransferase